MIKKIKSAGIGFIIISLFGASNYFYDRHEKQKIYITAFNSFYGLQKNQTEEVAEYFSRKGYNTEILDVDYYEAPKKLREIIRKKSGIVISMGAKYEVEYINISTTAKNIMSSDIPDNSNRIFKEKKIDENFPEKVVLDENRLNFALSRWDSNRIKYKIENDAGTYVCNSLLFAGIDEARKNEKTSFYFFHVPYDIYQDKEKLDNLEDAINSLL